MAAPAEIERSLIIGECAFPQREDYLAAFGLGQTEVIEPDVLSPADVTAIQQDWHGRGQNGCVFAMRAAKSLDAQQWSHDVHYQTPDPEAIKTAIEDAVNEPSNQAHSLLLPNIHEVEDVLTLIEAAVEAGCTIKNEDINGADITRLRWQIGDVKSLVIGFAPVSELPLTRRAPFAELFFKTKPKNRTVEHPGLDQRDDRTHAGDLDPGLMGLNSEQIGRLIEKAELRTARILGGKACRDKMFDAKARTTFGLRLKQG